MIIMTGHWFLRAGTVAFGRGQFWSCAQCLLPINYLSYWPTYFLYSQEVSRLEYTWELLVATHRRAFWNGSRWRKDLAWSYGSLQGWASSGIYCNISFASRLSDLSSVRLNGASTRFPVERDVKSYKCSSAFRPMYYSVFI